MKQEFPGAVPEVRVTNVSRAAVYYEKCLGFTLDWGGEDGGIAGISKGECRLFLTNSEFRTSFGNAPPMLIWFNLDGRGQVDDLFATWNASGARIGDSSDSVEKRFGKPNSIEKENEVTVFFYVTRENLGLVRLEFAKGKLILMSMKETLC